MSNDVTGIGIWAEWLTVLLAWSVARVVDYQLTCVAEFFCPQCELIILPLVTWASLALREIPPIFAALVAMIL